MWINNEKEALVDNQEGFRNFLRYWSWKHDGEADTDTEGNRVYHLPGGGNVIARILFSTKGRPWIHVRKTGK